MVPAEIGAMFIGHYSRYSFVVPMHFNMTFSYITQRCTPCQSQKFLVSFKSPDRHSLLIPVIKSISIEYAKIFRCPQPKIKRIKARGFCRPVDWASTS
jgi:hypothetical protein